MVKRLSPQKYLTARIRSVDSEFAPVSLIRPVPSFGVSGELVSFPRRSNDKF